MSELYAMLHRGHPGDIAFYLRLCEVAAAVLELGVGYGRVALPLARAGHLVVGLDIDEHLLALAREAARGETSEVKARLSLVCGDMATMSLGRLFDRVLVPFNAICCLLSRARLVACFRQIGSHLAPGGLLALDTYRAEHLHGGGDVDDDNDFEPVVAFAHSTGVLDVLERSSWEPALQRLDTTYRFVPRDGGELFEQTIKQRYLLASELERLLAETGFHVVDRAGGFLGEQLDDDAEHMVVVAEHRP